MAPFFNEKSQKNIQIPEAANLSGYSKGYLSYLCRTGKILGTYSHNEWSVDLASLEGFMRSQSERKEARARSLASSRAIEYQSRRPPSPASNVPAVVHAPPPARRSKYGFTKPVFTPAETTVGSPSLFSKYAAGMTALAVITLSALAAHTLVPPIAVRVASLTKDAAFDVRIVFGDVSARIAEKVEEARKVEHAHTPLALADVRALAQPDLSALRMNVDSARRVSVSMEAIVAGTLPASTRMSMDGELRTLARDAYHLLTSPSATFDALMGAHAILGERAYTATVASFSTYRSLIDTLGERSLALAVSARDLLSRAPRFVSDLNLALGSAIVNASHAAIRADASLAYGLSKAAPKSAAALAALFGTAGDTLARTTARIPALATSFFLDTAALPSELAPTIAEAVFDAEYRAAERFLALSDRTARLSLASLFAAGHFAQDSLALLRAAPPALDDAYLGTIGKGAVAINQATAPLLAAIAPSLSAGEELALATYQTIQNLFDATNRMLALLLGPPPVVVSNPPPTRSVLTTLSASTTPATYTTIVQGISLASLDQSLATLRANIIAEVSGMINPVATQVAYDHVFKYTETAPFNGGSVENDVSAPFFTASDADGTNAFAGTFSAGTTTVKNLVVTNTSTSTFAGPLSVAGALTVTGTTTAAGFISTNLGVALAPAYTFQGDTGTGFWSPTASTLALSTGGVERLRIDADGNVGIGTSSPDALLSLQQVTNGTTFLSAYRVTDIAPSGDFISFKQNDGTTLFRVDNSGNLLAGGIINSGSQTITSTSQPQFRIQYDPSNEITFAAGVTGTTTVGLNGTAPGLAFTPQSNLVNQFNFTNASSDSVLSIDTVNKRVGVGTTSPWAQLSVNPNGITGPAFVVGSSTATNFIVTNAGKVGIGTAAPSNQLSVAGSIDLGTMGNFLTGYGRSISWSTAGTSHNDSASLMALSGNILKIRGSGAITLNEDNSGNVGIGTTSPWAQLSVNPNGITGPSFVIGSSTATNFIVTNKGNVGIGTTNTYTNGTGNLTVNNFLQVGNSIQGLGGGSQGDLFLGGGTGNSQVYINAGAIGSIVSGGISLGETNNYWSNAFIASTITFGSAGAGDTGLSRISAGKIGVGTGTAGSSAGTLIANTVGIGTTSPGAKLHIEGGTSGSSFASMYLINNTAYSAGSAVRISLAPDSAYGSNPATYAPYIESYAQNDASKAGLAFATYNGAGFPEERLRITAAGNVGIGTTSPSTRLHIVDSNPVGAANTVANQDVLTVDSNTYAYINLRSPSSGTDIAGGILFSDDARARGGVIYNHRESNAVSDRLDFLTSAGTRMSINSSGNVGIGTTTPGALLDVYKTGSNDPLVQFGSWGLTDNHAVTLMNGAGELDLFVSGASDTFMLGTTQGDVGMFFTSGDDFHLGNKNASPYVTVKDGGNVGIGILSPTALLDVSAAAASTDIVRIRAGGAGISLGTNASGFGLIGNTAFGSVITIDTSGNVGIGDTTPSYKLEVNGDFNATAVYSNGVLLSPGTGSNWSVSGSDIYRSAGNVGIGTTSPQSLLHLSSSSIDGVHFRLESADTGGNVWEIISTGSNNDGGAGNLRFYNGITGVGPVFTSTGNVGIGTTSPQSPLHIENGSPLIVTFDNDAAMSASRPAWAAGATGALYEIGSITSYSGTIVNDVTARLVIDASGLVGIGTSTPGAKLEIYDDTFGGATPLAVYGNSDNITITDISTNRQNQGSLLYISTPNELSNSNSIGMFGVGDASDTGQKGNLFHITQTGNVGIGTTTPGRALHVLSSGDQAIFEGTGNAGVDIRAQGAEAGNLAYLDLATNSTGVATPDYNVRIAGYEDNSLRIYSSDTNERIRMTSDGNVGIGTTSPWSIATNYGTLAIGGTDGGGLRFGKNNGGTARFYADDGGMFLQVASTTLPMVFATGGNERIRIDKDGNVGIGTTSPAAQGSGASPRILEVYGGSDVGMLNLSSSATSDGSSAGAVAFITSASPSADKRLGLVVGANDGSSAASTNGRLTFWTNNAGTIAERMRIDKSGNVGIGTTDTSTYKVNVNGSLNATEIRVNGVVLNPGTGSNWTVSGSDIYRLAGNVGIGTTSPASLLHVNGPGTFTPFGGSDARQVVITTPGGTDGGIVLSANSSDATTRVDISRVSGDLTFALGSGTAERMRITSSGNVGIGTTTPSNKLTIYTGNIANANEGISLTRGAVGAPQDNVFGMRLKSDASGNYRGAFTITSNIGNPETEALTIGTGGNVGIGTTSPETLLDVNKTVAGGEVQLRVKNPSNSASAAASVIVEVGGSSATGDARYVTSDGTTYWAFGQDISASNAFKISQNAALGTNDFLTILTSGNVGIGTTSPQALLHLNSTGNTVLTIESVGDNNPAIRFRSNDIQKAVLGYDKDIDAFKISHSESGTSFTDNQLIIKSGNVGIGTTTPTSYVGATRVLDVYNAVDTSISIGKAGKNYEFFLGSDNALTFRDSTAGVVRMLISSSGLVGIGTTSPATLLEVGGSTNNITFDGYKNCTGYTSNSNGLLACTASDQRLKQDISPLAGASGLAAIGALNPVSFYWKPAAERGTNEQFGLIAQDVRNVFPNLVTTTNPTPLAPDGTLTIDYQGLIAPMVLAIQQLDARTKFIVSAASSTALTVGNAGDIGVGTSIAGISAKFSVSGNVFATSYETANIPATSFTLGSTNSTSSPQATFTAQIPSAVLTALGSVDLYKLATYNLSGISALALALEEQEARITSLESRVAALENGTITSTSGTTSLSTTSLTDALNTLGVFIKSGFAQFGTLVADRFVAAADSAGTASAGTVTILAGNTVAQVNNAYVTPATKVFITFTAPVTGSWYINDKKAGSFKVVLANAQTTDASFDYFLVQTEGQMATTTTTISGPSVELSGGTTATSQTTTTSTTLTAGTTDTSTTTATSTVGTTGPTATTTPSSSDTIAPVVTLNGDAAMQITVGDTFTDPGATASDPPTDSSEQATDLTAHITVSGAVNTATAGLYTLTYSATDAAGNTGSASRVVTVAAPATSTSSPQASSPSDGTTTTTIDTTTSTTDTTTATTDTTSSTDTTSAPPVDTTSP